MLFKTIDEVKEYVTLNSQTKISVIKPHIERAEHKYIKTYLGKDLYKSLHDYVNDTSEGKEADEALDTLLPFVLLPLALFSYKDAIPQLNVVATQSGFAVTQNPNLAPASKQRTDDLKDSQEEAAWDGIEVLLEFLEENKEDYDQWVSSKAYTLAHRNLINSANDFSQYADINMSRLAFMKLRSTMDNVENLIIANAISKEQLDAIKTELEDDDLSEANELIIENLQRALANLALAEQKVQPDKDSTNVYAVFNIGDDIREHKRRIGISYLAKATDTIKSTPADYPEYMASSLYTADTTDTKFENTEESPIFVFGG